MAALNADELFFLQADLLRYLEEKDEWEQSVKAKNIFSTYFSQGEALTDEFQKMIEDHKQQSERELMEDLHFQVWTKIQEELDFMVIVKGSVRAAIYQKRSGGIGDIPMEVFARFREQMDLSVGWILKYDNKGCQVYAPRVSCTSELT
eukprot:TRINITY_DN1571_c0_g1_i3.p1 TRINITY_DN1571_c0_g1~~TRINITY_DN1571_c0_g1_i3.p1  ORF type:complete len:168 (+),score=34.32 TRINITY_DN1571_c0_g1_i3:61-504(+)